MDDPREKDKRREHNFEKKKKTISKYIYVEFFKMRPDLHTLVAYVCVTFICK